MSDKNVDKKKMGADIKNPERMFSLVKEASLSSGEQPLKVLTSFIGPLKPSVVGTALFKEHPIVTFDSKNLTNANISTKTDHENMQLVLYKPQGKVEMPGKTINDFNTSKIFFDIQNNPSDICDIFKGFNLSGEVLKTVGDKITNGQSSSNKEKPLLLTDGRELKDSELKGGELADLDDIFGLKNKSVKDFTDDDKRKSKIKEILLEAIKNVSDPSFINSLSRNEFLFLSQSNNSSALAKIIASINENNAWIYRVAEDAHNDACKIVTEEKYKQYKREILRQKFVLSGLLDPGSRKIIHQSINDEKLMLAFCKEANVSYRIVLFGFLPEKLQTIENVYEIFADLKGESKGGNDNKDNRFERFVKATLERYRLGPEKNILEELKKLKSEGQIKLELEAVTDQLKKAIKNGNIPGVSAGWERLRKLKSENKISSESITDQLKEAIENGDKLGAGITEVLEFLRGRLNSKEEGNVPPEKTLTLLKTIWEKRRNYGLDEDGLEKMFRILNDLIQDGMATSNVNDVLRFISDMLNPKNPKVIFNNKACEEMFVLIDKILDKNENGLNGEAVDSMLMALIGAIKEKNITGLTTRPVLELINRVIESRLNSSVMADLFKALASIIEKDDTINSDLVKDFFTLIKEFAFKEQSTQGDPVRNSMLNAFFELRQKWYKLEKEKVNKVELKSKPDVVSILGQIKTFSEARKTNLLYGGVLLIVKTLESMMMLGDLSQIDLNEYLPMFTEIWEAANNIVSDSNDLSSIAQCIFGSLLFAIKLGNKDNLANLKMEDIFQLYQNVLKALSEKTESVIRPMFAALKYVSENELENGNVKNVTTTQVYNLVEKSGVLSDSKFQISIGTAQIIFSVLLAVLKIENRDESKVKSLFDAVNLDSIGLAFREGKIELLDESKAKDTIFCYACINLFYTKLEEIFKEKIFKSETKEIEKEKPKEAELPGSKENTVENRLNSSIDNIYRGNSNNGNEYVSRLSKQEKEEEQNNNQNKDEQNDIINGNINKNEEENINNSNSDNNMGSKDNNDFADYINSLGYVEINGREVALKPPLGPIEEESKEDQDIDDIQNNVNKEQNDDISVEIKNISSKNENTRENPQQIIFKKLDAYFKKSGITAKSPRGYEPYHANNQLRKKSEGPKNPQTIQKSLNKNNFIPVTWTDNFWLSLKNLFFEIIGRRDKIIIGWYITTQVNEQKNAGNASVPNKPVTKILLHRPIMYNECEKLSKDNQGNVI